MLAAVTAMTVLRMIQRGDLKGQQLCKGAPWVIRRQDIEDQHLIERLKTGRKGPPSPNPDQQTLIFQ